LAWKLKGPKKFGLIFYTLKYSDGMGYLPEAAIFLIFTSQANP
jgi:hypothetical protein